MEMKKTFIELCNQDWDVVYLEVSWIRKQDWETIIETEELKNFTLKWTF